MFEENYGTNMSERITIVLGHLQMESSYLDTVIESSLKIQELLRESRQSNPSSGDDAAKPSQIQAEKNERIAEQLGEIRWDISNQFIPVLVARKKLPEILKQFDPAKSTAPSLSQLSGMINEPFRTKLEDLGREIQDKLNRIYSINMGSQTILLYTLDYYERLLHGSEVKKSHYYNATGQSHSSYTASALNANC